MITYFQAIFLVATHIATAFVLFLFFWKDWFETIKGFLQSLRNREIREVKDGGSYEKLAWLLVVGTIPAGVAGLLLEEPLRAFFASPQSAAFFLIFNGFILYGGELLRRRKKEASESINQAQADFRISKKLSWSKAFGVGFAQVIALLPGFSRSGSTITGGLLAGLSHEDSLRYSFLLATPIIAAAGILKLPDLFSPENHYLLGPAAVGALASGLAAFFSVKFLVRFFKTNKMTPFAIYSITAGVLASIYFLLR